ncbi:hypothetical protein AYJ54_00255 [Bradyrhizobium centrolobii]|uniref:Uncharacterized protein n=1 Tax=Bradyrhizobium centrolobii TaxID=1505087 RepID=A0A176YKM9_9BRAD|nr:hypothetical protein AYJ54_00255 [Bradyrhizobium centrolobii]
MIEVRCAKVEQIKATALSNSDAFPDKKIIRTQAAFQGGVELIIQRAPAFEEYSGGDRGSVNLGKKNRQVIIFCKRSMQVLKKSKGLREETIFGFSNMTMHLIEDMKIMELLARTDLDAAPLSLPDILTSCPQEAAPYFKLRSSEVDAVPSRFADLHKALIFCGQLITKTAKRDWKTQGNQRGNKLAPSVAITN